MTDDTREKDNTQAGQDKQSQKFALPKIDFSTFVLSINSSALVQLGLIDDPVSGQKTKNLPLSRTHNETSVL